MYGMYFNFIHHIAKTVDTKFILNMMFEDILRALTFSYFFVPAEFLNTVVILQNPFYKIMTHFQVQPEGCILQVHST